MKSSVSTVATHDPHALTLRSMNQRIDAYTSRLQAVFSSAGLPDDATNHAKSTRSISSRYSKPSPASRKTGVPMNFDSGRHKYPLCEEVVIEDGKKRARLLCDSRLHAVQKKIDEVQTANLSHTSRHQSPSIASLRNRMEVPTPDRQLERLRLYGAASERGVQAQRAPSNARDRLPREERSKSRPQTASNFEQRPRDPPQAYPANDEYLINAPMQQARSSPRDADYLRSTLHQRQASHLRDAAGGQENEYRSYRDRVSLRAAPRDQGPRADSPRLGSGRDLSGRQCTMS